MGWILIHWDFNPRPTGLELIPILTSIATSFKIGLGPVYRVINTTYRAQTSTTVGNDTSSIGITSIPSGTTHYIDIDMLNISL